MDFRQNDNMVRVGPVVSSCGKAQPGGLAWASAPPTACQAPAALSSAALVSTALWPTGSVPITLAPWSSLPSLLLGLGARVYP